MRGKRILILCTTCLILATFVVPAFATRHVLSVPAYQQEQSNWCWAACDKMVIQYCKGTSPSQSSIVTFVFGSPVNNCASLSQTRSALTNWNVLSSVTSSALSYTEVQNNIISDCPIIAGLAVNGGGHMNVVRGFDTSNNSVLFIDPGDGGYHGQNYNDYADGYHYDGYYYTWQETIEECR